MVAEIDLKMKVDKRDLADALKEVETGDVGIIIAILAEFYISTGPEGSPRRRFGEALRESREIINQGSF